MRRCYIAIFLAITLGLVGFNNPKTNIEEIDNVTIQKKSEVDSFKPSPQVPLHAVIPAKEVEIPKQNIKEVRIIATAYTADPKENGNNHSRTASGKIVSRGMVATPRDIPFGSKIVIHEMGEYTVEDRGNPKYIRWIDANTIRIDIFMTDKAEALKFGVKHLTGYIIEE